MRRHIPKESRIESVAVEIMRQLLRMAWNGSAVVIAEHRILYPWEAGIIIIAIFVGKNYKRGSCMSKIAIVTDSNSGISQAQAKEMGVYVLPMPFLINGKEYLDGIDLFTNEFYKFLEEDADVSTSQPSPDSVMKLWDGSCQTAKMLADDYDGKVQVVNNQRISVTQLYSVEDAKAFAEAGMNAEQICKKLEEEALESSIYVTVTTLKYLKKGGRITPAAAALGTMLRLKPVLQIHGEKLDAFSKVRTMSAAKKTMLDAMRNDLENRFAGSSMRLAIAHTNNEAMALEFKAELEKEFPGYPEIIVNELSLSVACHIGDGTLAVACSRIPEV